MSTITMTDTPEPRWHTYEDADAVARATADWILGAARTAMAEGRKFRLVLAGGRTPEKAYRLLTNADTNWGGWEIFYGDERCLPVDDSERNSVMARRAWLDQVDIPASQDHPIPAELGSESAAAAYGDLISSVLPFDLVLLGIGEDGHTASLFPGHEHSADELVHPVHDAPKPPPDRVSLSRNTLANTRGLLVLVTGDSKCNAVDAWKNGESIPVASIHPESGVDVLIDHAALGTRPA